MAEIACSISDVAGHSSGLSTYPVDSSRLRKGHMKLPLGCRLVAAMRMGVESHEDLQSSSLECKSLL